MSAIIVLANTVVTITGAFLVKAAGNYSLDDLRVSVPNMLGAAAGTTVINFNIEAPLGNVIEYVSAIAEAPGAGAQSYPGVAANYVRTFVRPLQLIGPIYVNVVYVQNLTRGSVIVAMSGASLI
jgi:hypothetical protein